MIATTAEVQEESAAIPFMVLQCKGCRTIVGDTGSLLNLQKENLIITLTSNNHDLDIYLILQKCRQMP